MKTKIQKSAAGTSTDTSAEVFELTGIKTEEVSLVDKPANGRKFLVKKRSKPSADASIVGTADGEPVIDLAATAKGEAPGADLDAAEAAAAGVSDSEKVIAAKDAADAAAYAAEKANGKPGTTPTTAAAPATKAIDTAAELASLVAAVKTDITVAPGADGTVTVTVEDEPSAEIDTTSAAPAAVVDAVRAAVLAGIDAVAARLAAFRTKVETDKNVWSLSGVPYMWSDIDYLTGMLYALHDIGGPSWEIEAAGDAATDLDKAALAKGHKAITGSRVAKFKAIHKGLSYCMKDYGALMKELDSEAEDTATDVPADTAKAVAVVPAPLVPEIVKTVSAIPAAVEKDINDLRAAVATLSKTVSAQATQLAKSRDTVQGSNSAPPPEETKQNHDTFIWPTDLASPAERVKVQRR